MDLICKKLSTKLGGFNINELIFIYNGEIVNLNSKINEIANSTDINRGILSILVDDKNSIKREGLIPSKEIICKLCGEQCRFNLKDFKINLYQCKNGHNINNIFLDNYFSTQMINQSKIKCHHCSNNKFNSYNNQFYKCLTCNQNLCPICSSIHNKGHNVISYDNKNYICSKHNDSFDSYCEQCNLNICMLCQKNHKGHKIIYFRDIIQDNEEISENLEIFKEKIIKLKEITNNIITMLNKVISNMDIYYKINFDIINNYKVQNKNYEYLQNINEVKYNLNINELNKIIKIKDINNQFSILMDIYKKMTTETKEDNGQENNSNRLTSTVTENPPRNCLIYEEMAFLNQKYNKLEKEVRQKSAILQRKLNEMKNKIYNQKNKTKKRLSNGNFYGQIFGDEDSIDWEGIGVIEFDNGGKYEGEILNGVKHGIGILSGDFGIIMGEFENDGINGFGIQEHQTNGRYEGTWENNSLTGFGIRTFKYNNLYIGGIFEANISGEGKYVYDSGDYYIGEFREGIRVKGKLYYKNEKGVFDSVWSYNEEKNETIAKGIFYLPDGTKEKRTRIIDNVKGIWEYDD